MVGDLLKSRAHPRSNAWLKASFFVAFSPPSGFMAHLALRWVFYGMFGPPSSALHNMK